MTKKVWPTEFEDYITSNPLPIAELDLPLQDFVNTFMHSASQSAAQSTLKVSGSLSSHP